MTAKFAGKRCVDSRVAASLLAIAATALALSACGEETVDTSQIEGQIKTQLSSGTVQIESVSCPSDVEKKEGDTFDCDAKTAGGGSATVVVTQENGRNQYTYAFKPDTLVVPGSALEPVVEEDLKAEGVNVTAVDCPEDIAVKAGTTVSCTAATASGATLDVTFELTSTGEVDPDSVESSSG